MKIMAIDYGDARTGIAVSDALGMLVGVTDVIHQYNKDKVAEEIARRVKEYGVGELVMGLPKNMDGTEGPRAELYKEFAAKLEQVVGLPVILWDERRTTVDAHRILSENNVRGKKRKNTVDAVAAALILEAYLAFRK
ncbi:MAG: Holliday junction resolvase RuvX [Oscillospiraceae bacterium]|nr:Holliday junction resolvase RuvX [Oscillospiraceae bacterium]